MRQGVVLLLVFGTFLAANEAHAQLAAEIRGGLIRVEEYYPDDYDGLHATAGVTVGYREGDWLIGFALDRSHNMTFKTAIVERHVIGRVTLITGVGSVTIPGDVDWVVLGGVGVALFDHMRVSLRSPFVITHVACGGCEDVDVLSSPVITVGLTWGFD